MKRSPGRKDNMCLASAGKISRIIDASTAEVDFEGLKTEVKIMLLDNLKTGDYVLVHAGFAINRLSKKDAEYIISASKESGLI
jgi:hydrogenase expression/formation protein HypC